MTREEIVNSMSLQDAIQVFKDTNTYGTMDIAKSVILKALEQEPCDAVSRKEVMNMLHNHAFDYATSTKILALLKTMCGEVDRMPSVTPQYTDAEIQKMQDFEFAEIQKAYEIGKEEGSSEKPNKWIPVSERLPEKLQEVLVTFYDAEGEYDIAYRRKTFNESYKAQGSEDEWVSSMGETTYADYEISAWMPIKPYKASPTETESEKK